MPRGNGVDVQNPEALENHEARIEDIDLLLDVANNIEATPSAHLAMPLHGRCKHDHSLP